MGLWSHVREFEVADQSPIHMGQRSNCRDPGSNLEFMRFGDNYSRGTGRFCPCAAMCIRARGGWHARETTQATTGAHLAGAAVDRTGMGPGGQCGRGGPVPAARLQITQTLTIAVCGDECDCGAAAHVAKEYGLCTARSSTGSCALGSGECCVRIA